VSLLRPGDIAVLALAAIVVGGAYGTFWTDRTPGQRVIITVSGLPVGEHPLSEPATLAVEGGIGTSHLEIAEGRVRFTDSPCNGRYCVHSGWLSKTGQVAACLPNGVVVEVLGGEREYDAISL
jgi:hypothetical protein